MGGDNLYDLIQSQVFILSNNVIGGNRIFQVYAVTSCVLAESVDISGNIRFAKHAQLNSLEVLPLIVQRQGIFTVTMHQLQ